MYLLSCNCEIVVKNWITQITIREWLSNNKGYKQIKSYLCASDKIRTFSSMLKKNDSFTYASRVPIILLKLKEIKIIFWKWRNVLQTVESSGKSKNKKPKSISDLDQVILRNIKPNTRTINSTKFLNKTQEITTLNFIFCFLLTKLHVTDCKTSRIIF